MESCPICGGSAWDPLANPHPRQSMASDLRIVHAPLSKSICRGCGVIHRRAALADDLFTSGYSLYDHAPGAARERARQEAYASWISAQFDAPPASVIDDGCGNGSLLIALEEYWPAARLSGVDPSAESVARARAAGIAARVGALGDAADRAAAVISVNVIEHTQDPAAFMRDAAAALDDTGDLIVVCPDGRQPWSELLIVDHRWSFTAAHLHQLCDLTGLCVIRTLRAPAALGSFMMVRASRRPRRETRSAGEDAPAAADRSTSIANYMERWTQLDACLGRRVPPGELICFGIGEAAGLLRAYAPRTWSRVSRCVADGPEDARFGDLHVDDYSGLGGPATLLLGVHPRAQASVAARLCADGHRVIRWDDVIAG